MSGERAARLELTKTEREVQRMKKNSRRGFTLAELLIVVAIIAILAAVAVPMFGEQLTKVQLEADFANFRSAYTQAVADAMLSQTPDKDGKYQISVNPGFQNKDTEISVAGSTVTLRLNGMEETFEIDPEVDLSILSAS